MNDFTRFVNGIAREGRRQQRYEQREDRNSMTNDLLLAETREQRGDRSNVLDAPEMRNILASGRDLNNPLRVIPGDQPGTYRFTSGQLVTGDMRLSPEAIQDAQQILGNRWQAPRVQAPLVAPEAAVPSTPDPAAAQPSTVSRAPTAAPEVAAPDASAPPTPTAASVQPAPAPAQPTAAPVAGFEAPQGAAARAYNNVNVPTGLHQNQVDNVQQLLIDAGLDVGGQGGVPDNKWGRKSQAAFEQVCREAQPPIDPATVDFANPQDQQTQQFLQAAQARAAERTGARGPEMPPAPATDRTADQPTLPPTDLVYRGEPVTLSDGVYRGEPVRAIPLGSDLPPGMAPEPASQTIEQARTRVMGELQGTVGRQEATIVESMIATASPVGPRLTDRNGEVNSSELGAFQGVVSSITTIEGLDQLREQMRAAGVRDGQPVATGESPQGNRIQADPNRIASISEGITIA